MPSALLRFQGLGKSYGARQVFYDVRAEFGRGVHALRGQNGIGKSTLLRVLAGVEEADAGEVWIAGASLCSDPVVARSRLAWVPDACPVYPFLSGRELLAFVGYAKRCAVGPDVLEVAARFGLGPHLDTRCGAMSLGTQKKLMLAAAWIGAPAVLLLDEPSNGLDADARAVLVDLLREKGAGAAVLVSTHDGEIARALGASVIEFDALRGDGATAA